MKVGLLLEGGAMRGLFTAGVIDTLMENNILVDTVIGVSAGALFGMNYKSHQVGRVLRYNKKFCKNKNYTGFYSLLTTGNIMNKEFCFDKLVNELDPFDFETFKNSNINFYVVITNMNSGKAEYKKLDDLKKIDQMETLRASGSMPYVSKPVIINNDKYLDGAIADSIPIDKILEMDLDKIIVILTRPSTYRKKKGNKLIPKLYYKKYPNFINAINSRYLKYNEELDKVHSLEKEGKVFVVRPSRVVDIKRTEKDPKKIQEMYDLGVSDMKNNLSNLMNYLDNNK